MSSSRIYPFEDINKMKFIGLIISFLLINTFGFPRNFEYDKYKSDFNDFIKIYNKKYFGKVILTNI